MPDRHYVRLHPLAASAAASEVEAALGYCITPTLDAVCDLVRTPSAQRVPELGAPVLDPSTYD